MAQTPFTADAGTYQGRILSAAAVHGSYVYELGHALPGRLYVFNPGDAHRITQTCDFTGLAAFRVTLITRGVTTMPAGAQWTVRMLVDGVPRVTRAIDARSIVLTDFAVNVGYLTGDHQLAFEIAIAGGTGPYEAELPGCAVDAVVADDTGVAIELVNRNPQPNETGTLVSGPLVFHVESSSGSLSPEAARTDVYVDGVAVCLSGTFQAGWMSSTRTTTTSGGWAFSLAPDAPLAPSATHTIHVISALTTGPATQLDESWVFSTVDTVSPTVTAALAIREKEIRVMFSEAVAQEDSTAGSDALNPANYSIALVDGWPAVTPVVVGVESDGPDRVVLVTDTPMTRRATYLVTASNVADLVGNVIGAPTNTALFIGYGFPAPAERYFDLYQLWVTQDQKAEDAPPNGKGELRTLFAIWQEPIDLLLGVLDKLGDIYDPDVAPEVFVDMMLVEQGNPFDFRLSENEKRRLAQILIPIYKTKGTGPGIVDAIRLFMGIEVYLNVYAWSPVPLGEALMGITWILGSSDPQDLLTFQVIVPRVLTDDERKKMTQIIDYMMDAREFFVLIEPADIVVPDHWQMGYSNLGVNTYLH